MALVKTYLRLSQIFLFVPLLICTFIIPSVIRNNGGVSNFGDHASTRPLYILSFGMCILFLGLAARAILLAEGGSALHAAVLLLIGVLQLAVLLSTFPRKFSWTYSELHDDLGIALYSYEFVLSVWFIVRCRSGRNLLYILIEAIGSLIGLLSILKIIHLLYIGQIIGAIGFGCLLVATFPTIAGRDRAASVSGGGAGQLARN